MTTQDARPICPRVAAIAGKAVATMVWSTTARNIGSMIEGKTRKNRFGSDPGAPTAVAAVGEGAVGPIGCELRAGVATVGAGGVGGGGGGGARPPPPPLPP